MEMSRPMEIATAAQVITDLMGLRRRFRMATGNLDT
jgi:hypothetical protein